MHRQEAEAWAERLTRIWSIDPTTVDAHRTTPYLWFNGDTTERMRFSYWQDYMLQVEGVRFARFEEGAETGRLEWKGNLIHSIPIENRHRRELYQEFADQWLPIFRRNCWLSGCPIEASAHEKAEWIHGFTREELEAWNLKM